MNRSTFCSLYCGIYNDTRIFVFQKIYLYRVNADCNVALAGSPQIGHEVYREGLTHDIIACFILNIDDGHIICKLIEAHLRHIGYTNIRFAYDSRSGLENIYSNQPDIVILDVQMPKMDVIAVLKEIRRQVKYDNILTTIETAVDVKKYRDELLRAGP